jgi:serine/threonine protein kinase
MAPEQIQGHNLTLKADLFSFGTILWELATEKIPHFDVRDSMEALRHAVCKRGLVPKLPGKRFAANLGQSAVLGE